MLFDAFMRLEVRGYYKPTLSMRSETAMGGDPYNTANVTTRPSKWMLRGRLKRESNPSSPTLF